MGGTAVSAVLRVGQNAIATLAVVEPNGRAAPFQRLSHGGNI